MGRRSAIVIIKFSWNQVFSIKSFDSAIPYTTIPHQKLQNRLTSIIRNSLNSKNGNRRYKYLVLGHEETYFVKEHSDCKSMRTYSEDDIIKMLEFLVDTIFVAFAGNVFKQTAGIQMGTYCAPLLADIIFFYSFKAEFKQSLLSDGKKQLAPRFNFRFINDVLSINNPEKLSGSDVSCWDSIYKRRARRFQFPHYKLSVPPW